MNAVIERSQATDTIARSLARRRRSDRRWARISFGAGVVIISGLVILAAIHSWLGLPGPNEQNLLAPLNAPSGAHPFGTDDVGRDILSRSLAALGIDLQVAAEVTALSVGIGIALGAVAGFFGGIVDIVIMRLADVVIAFPFMVMVIAIIAIFGPGLTGIYVGVPAAGWALYARFSRGEMLRVRESDFIKAAYTLGFRRRRILLRHALPNVVQPAIVYSTIDVVLNIVLLASLSYLGLGVQPPTAELGSMISGGQQYILSAWWMVLCPGVVLVVIGVGFSLVGDGLAARLGQNVSWGK
jgi:peptide/nickel transport system permease protein